MSGRTDVSNRLKKLPPYLFVEIDRQKKRAIENGRDIIDLGVGDPDGPTPAYIIKALNRAAKDPANHHYPMDKGLSELREEMARWYKDRFNIKLNPDTEVLPLLGSKEGIAHIPLAFMNPGDVGLVPNPCYPPYRSGVIFAGGEVCDMPLKEENSFLPDFSAIDGDALKRARLLYLNYPNNPTGAVADKDFYRSAVEFARKNNVIVISDAAYTEVFYDGHAPSSFLEVEGARDVGVEFHSLSKTYNMTGWRVGMACGNSDVIAALSKVKSNIDSGIFKAIQYAGMAALRGHKKEVEAMRKLYQERRDVLVDGLNSIGWEVSKPKATFYIWARTLKSHDSASMCRLLLADADLVITPGVGFGDYGEGYIRMAITVPRKRLKEAVKRIKKVI